MANRLIHHRRTATAPLLLMRAGNGLNCRFVCKAPHGTSRPPDLGRPVDQSSVRADAESDVGSEGKKAEFDDMRTCGENDAEGWLTRKLGPNSTARRTCQ